MICFLRKKSYCCLIFLYLITLPVLQARGAGWADEYISVVPKNCCSLRHLIAYGGIKDKYIPAIAENVDILIAGRITHGQIRQLKNLNPDIKILKYFNLIGASDKNSYWNTLNNYESWFVHDLKTGMRLVAEKYGWYLMNLGSSSLRSFLSAEISRKADSFFDGVFLDDCWAHFIDKFSTAQTRIHLRHDVRDNWRKNIILFLQQLRMEFKKSVFINGQHEAYIRYVDGLLDEDFIHNNNQPDNEYRHLSYYYRKFDKIKRLKTYGKILLFQSGTIGDSDDDQVKLIYDFCYGNYLLICDQKTSFGFKKGRRYYFQGFLSFENADKNHMPMPLADYYYICSERPYPNLLKNATWSIISGTPYINATSNGISAVLTNNATAPDAIKSPMIHVDGGIAYRLYVHAVCVSGKDTDCGIFGLWGRFFDKDLLCLPGIYGFWIYPDNFNWAPFETRITAPERACYFQLQSRFSDNSYEQVCMDNISFSRQAAGSVKLRRDFRRMAIVVDITNYRTIKIKL